ncbi:hypothetical protein E5161_15465 [Cohnella pontilimi]|uniref:Uncharacterized protein n=1 Tax=Cohnella pontilimi TaxID=2564100 RepID=A0A4U0FAC7_9BACL|nr:hypothetical protein [Cohnella pontilimi]TJY41094.1 hypothetical protein E5161_15465 [Cohnella pontilimi]
MNLQMTKEFYERIETEVEQSLKPKGYRKTKHQHSQMNGNMYSVFDSAGGLTRLIWDAKDRRLIIRVYKKGTWLMKLGKALIGRNDDEKLLRELIINREEFTDSTEEQVIKRIVDAI